MSTNDDSSHTRPPSRTTPDDSGSGCREYLSLDRSWSRRSVLRGLGSGAAASVIAGSSPAWLPRVSWASSADSSRDVLISIFLRGGADGLTLVPPYLETNLERLRPTLAMRPPDANQRAALDLDGQFGLAPALAPLLDAWSDRQLAIVHATGSRHETRSHFSAMHFMEVGRPDPTLLSGWIGRHLAATPPLRENAALRALGIGFGLPRSLAGGDRTLPIARPDLFDYNGPEDSAGARERALQALHPAPASGSREPLLDAAQNTFRTVELLQRLDVGSYRGPGDRAYPDDEFGMALRSTAALIRADEGVEAVAIDFGGWDTHDEQGPFDGQMASLMTSLADGLAALHADLFTSTPCGVTVVVQSEFGRNVFENGSRGTDHGHGNVMFVLGPTVDGGRVHADWPGLEIEQLWQAQDLDISWDHRDILFEIAAKRLASASPVTLFADSSYAPTDRGVFRE